MCKERWCELFDGFVSENEREPSDQEMQDLWSSSFTDRYDRLRDEYRNAGKLWLFNEILSNSGKL